MTGRKSPDESGRGRHDNLSERIYDRLKQDIFEFRLLPGDRFTESEIAGRVEASRTPVRQALYRLEREGFLEVYFRNGWRVRPFDFDYFEELYDVRIILELAAVSRLCEQGYRQSDSTELKELKHVWIESQPIEDGPLVSALDERFHCLLVEAAGNKEMARLHRDLSEKIRIIRRLDFTKPPRVEATYEEHALILRAVLDCKTNEASQLVRQHIEQSRAEVRKITLHMLHEAHQRARLTPA